jgi:hypothetical protein
MGNLVIEDGVNGIPSTAMEVRLSVPVYAILIHSTRRCGTGGLAIVVPIAPNGLLGTFTLSQYGPIQTLIALSR